MKKILFVGDVHGRDEWEDSVLDALKHFQDIVFVGDYVDSRDVSPSTIVFNLKLIIEYKIKYPDRITLLLGNHDWAYIHDRHKMSGWNWHMWLEYKQLFLEHYDLFQMAYGYTNPDTQKYTLVTHAGLTLTYYNNYIKTQINDPESALNVLADGKAKDLQLHEIFNLMKDQDIISKVGSVRGGMGTPGPIWADHSELIEDRYPGINQVVGHTATGTVSVTLMGNDLIAKVDGWYNNQISFLLLSL